MLYTILYISYYNARRKYRFLYIEIKLHEQQSFNGVDDLVHGLYEILD